MANFQADKTKVRQILDAVKKEGRDSLTAPEGKLVCDAYGINVPKEGVVSSAAEASKLAGSMGFPVVMKIVSPDILHKTEAGGVVVGVKNADEAATAYEQIIANAKKYNIDADRISWIPIKCAVAFVLATISWRLLEKPMLRLKKHFVSSRHPSAGTAIA